MPGKFFDQFLENRKVIRKQNPFQITQKENQTPAVKLIHPGAIGRIHTDHKGHVTWNRKGRW
ncbi:MAG: hypothetical protein Kow00108_07160 [Calditrichia bacterium]